MSAGAPDLPWADLADWWCSELASDETYEEVVTPALLEVLETRPNHRYLDLGCGEGRVMRTVGARGVTVYGADINPALLGRVGPRGVVADLPALPIRKDSFDGAYAVLVLEHLADHRQFFRETARVVKPRGALALVANHPVWTAPGSTPITDSDGEVLWRSGAYFTQGKSEIQAGESSVTFHHRSMAQLLNAAASAGWLLELMVEQPHHELTDQAGIPRLLACRWSLQDE